MKNISKITLLTIGGGVILMTTIPPAIIQNIGEIKFHLKSNDDLSKYDKYIDQSPPSYSEPQEIYERMETWSTEQWNMEVAYSIFYSLKMDAELYPDCWGKFDIWIYSISWEHETNSDMYISFNAYVKYDLDNAPSHPLDYDYTWYWELYFKINHQKIELTDSQPIFAFSYNPPIMKGLNTNVVYYRRKGRNSFYIIDWGVNYVYFLYSWTYQKIILS